ncbi:MAG: hypothetical protein IPN33_16780 [Saprospiraceae bacterium]|nr:hypothetical protein [Saprospiraceae bacterium]
MADFHIAYWTAGENAAGFLGRQLQLQGLSWNPYELGAAVDCDVFILLSPVWCNNHFISCDNTWKKYFELNHPDVRFISSGFAELTHKNYIDLLNLPPDFSVFFTNAQRAGEEWEAANTGGLDMSQKLLNFFEGHGHDSIRQIFSPIYRILRIISDEIGQGTPYEELYSELITPNHLPQKWRIFQNRFSNYYPFFACLPFYPDFQQIKLLADSIDPYFESKCQDETLWKELTIEYKIREIHTLLSNAERYV